MKFNTFFICAVIAVVIFGAWFYLNLSLRVIEPYSFQTSVSAKTAAVYMEIENRTLQDDFLVGVRFSGSEHAEIHSMDMDGGIMRMRSVQRVEIPSKQRIFFAPGGLHLMLMGLKSPFMPGDVNILTLIFDKAGERQISVPVLKIGALK